MNTQAPGYKNPREDKRGWIPKKGSHLMNKGYLNRSVKVTEKRIVKLVRPCEVQEEIEKKARWGWYIISITRKFRGTHTLNFGRQA